MVSYISDLNPVLQALLATCFTWFVTAVGASAVFFVRSFSKKALDAMLGFAGGVMIAASFWSLLAPAIAMCEDGPIPAWIPAATGFMLGGVFLLAVDKTLPHLHIGFPTEEAEGLPSTWKRSVLLVLAITLHNIPEGLAVGVAFGAVAAGVPQATLAGACALALGIGLQNFPEGMAVGVSFGGEELGAATALAIGIGLQNIPEGLAIALLGAFWGGVYLRRGSIIAPVVSHAGFNLAQVLKYLALK